MEVIDYEPQLWFLLRENDDVYLDVRCQRGFMEYLMLVRLTPEERAAYRASGHSYADAMALDINDHPDRYRERDYEKELGSQVTQTVVAWRAANEENHP